MIESWEEAKALQDELGAYREMLVAMKSVIRHCERAYRDYDLCGHSWNALSVDYGAVERLVEQLEAEYARWVNSDASQDAADAPLGVKFGIPQ
jgi:hypothetical protein